jgi:hypothetical protein
MMNAATDLWHSGFLPEIKNKYRVCQGLVCADDCQGVGAPISYLEKDIRGPVVLNAHRQVYS